MNALSLFDGMSCGQIALENIGVPVDNYFAAEIKGHAIAVTLDNFPNTQHLGDVRTIKAADLPKIGLLIGGSPCQDFSRLNKKRDGLEGEKSGLFFEYLRLLEECKPDYFLLENVIMEAEQAQLISKYMGVSPVRINAELVGPVHRDRLYWTNIPGGGSHLLGDFIKQPTRIDVNFQSILTNGFTDRKKGRCLDTNNSWMAGRTRKYHRYAASRFGNLVFESKDNYDACVRAYGAGDEGHPAFSKTRALSRVELERCHQVQPGYCNVLTDRQVENVIGDGWHVGVIEHIFKGLLA